MKLFSNKKQIIQTDPSLKPSERFENVLLQTLEKEGFRHIKSKHEFVQDFEFGSRIISLSYNNSLGYISTVQYFIKIIFKDLEIAFKRIYPDYAWTNWTIHQNLHWTNSPLYDDKAKNYSDNSINKLADEFFLEIKPKIDLTFDNIKSYRNLNEVYNSAPDEFIDYLPPSRLEKRIVNGLILTKHFDPASFESIRDKYFVLLNKYKGNDLEDIRSEVIKGLEFLNNNEVKVNGAGNKL